MDFTLQHSDTVVNTWWNGLQRGMENFQYFQIQNMTDMNWTFSRDQNMETASSQVEVVYKLNGCFYSIWQATIKDNHSVKYSGTCGFSETGTTYDIFQKVIDIFTSPFTCKNVKSRIISWTVTVLAHHFCLFILCF